jgi:hypothetical protein
MASRRYRTKRDQAKRQRDLAGPEHGQAKRQRGQAEPERGRAELRRLHRATTTGRYGSSGRTADPTAGMPLGQDDPLTFPGQLEQISKLGAGLARQTGWRKVTARIAAAAVLVLVLLLLVSRAVVIFR